MPNAASSSTTTRAPKRGSSFRSAAHPQGASAALAYSRAMVRPLSATFVPLMLFALAAVLAGQRIWPHFFWAALPAVAVAWGWARFQLARTPAEMLVQPGQRLAAVRSVRDVLHGATPDWERLIRVRPERMPPGLQVHLGDASHRLLAEHWPHLDALRDALEDALRRTNS